jgi:Gram-negative bacterial TonB protein C-terminal
MRKVIVAALALTPMLLHAQANSPAQTQPAPSSTTFHSKLVQPAELNASGAVADTTSPVRVSTGVGAPKLIHTVAIESDSDWNPTGFAFDRETVVEMTVDATGKPSNLKLLQSLGPVMDHNVLTAVGQYRFTPGTLDGAPTAVPVNLHVVLRNSAQ